MSRGPGRGVAEAGQRTPSVVTVTRSHEKRFPSAGAGLGRAGLGWAGLGRGWAGPAGLVSWRRNAVYLPHAAPARQETLDISTLGEFTSIIKKYFHLHYKMLAIYIFFA